MISSSGAKNFGAASVTGSGTLDDTARQHPKSAAFAALRTLRRWAGNESGATAVEYSLLIAFISLAVLGAIEAMGSGVSKVATKLTNTLAGM